MALISVMSQRDGTMKRMHIDRKLFHVDGQFALGSAVIGVLLAAIYAPWW